MRVVRGGTPAVPAVRRHIIRRPRLTRVLDESGARVILLVAPAGYGKTTLAREWLEQGSRQTAWYRCGRSSADVAAFSVGVANAAASIVSGAGDRLRERLKASTHPDEDALELAELLVEDLVDWPIDAWLVMDDYQFAIGSRSSELFAERLLERSSVQVLTTSRRRPAWSTARHRAYGDVLEIDRTMLAMTNAEGRAVLASSKDPTAVLARAQGWPAVIGIAALTHDEAVPDGPLPTTLYDYFAEELYDAADDETRWGLCQLAIASFATRELGEVLLGDRLESVLEHGLRLGIASTSSQEDTIELHPLLQRFFRAKLLDFESGKVNEAISKAAHYLLQERKWDEVFEIVYEFGGAGIFEELLHAALPDVLRSGRVSTVERWVDFAGERYFRSPILDFAEAEISVRIGLHAKAEALALQAAQASKDQSFAATAFARAGRAAHLDGRPTDAVRSHRMALTASPSIAVEREALWGLVAALVETEEIEAALDALEALDRKTGPSVDDRLRVASGRYLISVRGGRTAEAAPLTAVLPLVDRSDDPMARSSFLNSCAIALTLNGRYLDAQRVAQRFLDEAEEFRLRFVLPYAHLRLASVAAGQRRFADAFDALERAETVASCLSDRWALGAVPAIRAMALLSAGESQDALQAARPVLDTSACVRAEMLAVRALAFACTGASEEALSIAQEACKTSSTLEARSLGWITHAIATYTSHDESTSRQASKAALDFAFERRTVDHFVTGYRACPDLLENLVGEDPRVPKLLVDAGDEVLARQIGVAMPRGSDPLSQALSRREREVFDLMAGGFTNKEIARRLYISESTAKVHVRHIFEKLNARTRTEAVIKGKERLAGSG